MAEKQKIEITATNQPKSPEDLGAIFAAYKIQNPAKWASKKLEVETALARPGISPEDKARLSARLAAFK